MQDIRRQFHRQPTALRRQQPIRFGQRFARHNRQRAQRRHAQRARLSRQRMHRHQFRLPLGAPGIIVWQ